jgi:hypothetical protein
MTQLDGPSERSVASQRLIALTSRHTSVELPFASREGASRVGNRPIRRQDQRIIRKLVPEHIAHRDAVEAD